MGKLKEKLINNINSWVEDLSEAERRYLDAQAEERWLRYEQSKGRAV